MNSSFSLYVLPSTEYIFERQSSATVSFVLESSSWPSSSSSSTGSMFERFSGVTSRTSDGNRRETAINASTVSVGFTQLFSGSVASRDNLNKTKKTAENDKGVINLVTILLVVSSCLLLWIIIIAVGLIRQRLEKRKQNASSRRDRSPATELDRSQDSTRNMPLHLRARMIYQGLQSYDISSQVPNGVTNNGKAHITPEGNIRKLSRNIDDLPSDNIQRNGNHIPRDIPDGDKKTPIEHDDNANMTLGAGVEIIISEHKDHSEPDELLTYDNIGMSKEEMDDSGVVREDVSDTRQTESSAENGSKDKPENTESNGLVNEGFLNNDSQEAEAEEQTTEL